MTLSQSPPTFTPDGRYLIVRGRLWRTTNPNLEAEVKSRLVADLMSARRAVAHAKRTEDSNAMQKARASVQLAKLGLGERGPVWWTDGAPDYNRRMLANTPYARGR